MMKRILTILAGAAVMLASCATVEDETGMTGGAIPAEEVREQITRTVYVPHVKKEIHYFNDGYVERYMLARMDEDMNITGEDYFDSFDALIESVKYKIADGAMVKSEHFNSRGELVSVREYRNNGEGSPVEVLYMDSDLRLQNRSAYEYDEDGRKVKWEVFNSDGVVLSTTLYSYSGGLNIRIDVLDPAGNLEDYFLLEYDEEGNIIRRTEYDSSDKTKGMIEFVYEAGKLVTEKRLRANGSVLLRIEYENDEHGNPVKEMNYDGNGNLKDYLEREYEYSVTEITEWK